MLKALYHVLSVTYYVTGFNLYIHIYLFGLANVTKDKEQYASVLLLKILTLNINNLCASVVNEFYVYISLTK